MECHPLLFPLSLGLQRLLGIVILVVVSIIAVLADIKVVQDNTKYLGIDILQKLLGLHCRILLGSS